MNKNNKIFLIIFLVILIGLGIYYFINNFNKINNSNYNTSKVSVKNNTENNTNNNNSPNNNSYTNNVVNKDSKNIEKKVGISEEQLSTFSTKIYNTDSARQNNISITCNTLNDTIVKKGEIFSFCSTVGQATSDKGYQEADIFDRNGNMKKGLGGGNCQVSTTLYNAVLNTPNLTIIERHEHSNYVPYIEKGKDAAVAYGSYDLKFRNDSKNDIKITTSFDNSTVTTTIFSIK